MHYIRAKSYQEIVDFCNHWDKERYKLEYDTDGIIIKVDDIALQEELGYTTKAPSGQLLINLKLKKRLVSFWMLLFRLVELVLLHLSPCSNPCL